MTNESEAIVLSQRHFDALSNAVFRFRFNNTLKEIAPLLRSQQARIVELSDHGWQHIANEWADMACNGIQWLKNIRDGISAPAEALSEMESNAVRIRALQKDTPPQAPAVPDVAKKIYIDRIEIERDYYDPEPDYNVLDKASRPVSNYRIIADVGAPQPVEVAAEGLLPPDWPKLVDAVAPPLNDPRGEPDENEYPLEFIFYKERNRVRRALLALPDAIAEDRVETRAAAPKAPEGKSK